MRRHLARRRESSKAQGADRLASSLRALSLGAFLLGLSILGGCAKPSPKKKPNAPKTVQNKAAEAVAMTLNTGPASAEAYGTDAAREHRWTLNWKAAEVDVAGGQASAGRLQGVTGTIYQESKPTCTFASDRGQGDRANRVLTLTQNVRVTSLSQKSVLICDRLVYDAGKKLLTATGNVRVRGEVGTIGTLSKVLATPDLKTVGTPDLFHR